MSFEVAKSKPIKEKDSYELEKKKSESSGDDSPKYLVEGYRWFDSHYGNTYHTVIITDLKTGKEVYRSKEMSWRNRPPRQCLRHSGRHGTGSTTR